MVAHRTICTAKHRAPESQHHPAWPPYPPALLFLCEGLRNLGVGIVRSRLDAGVVPQWVKCLPGKHETLRPIPRTPIKLLGVVSCPYSLRDGEVEKGGSWGSLAIQPSLLGELTPGP